MTVWNDILAYVMPQTPQKACTYCLVFGTRDGENEFVEALYNGLQAGMYKKILISGGPTMDNPQPEADVLAEKLIARGIAPEVILREPRAMNTLENVRYSKQLMEDRGEDVTELAIIGKLFSMRRYMMTLSQNWPEAKVVASTAINIYPVEPENWHLHDEFRTRILGELDRAVRYAAQGDIREIA